MTSAEALMGRKLLTTVDTLRLQKQKYWPDAYQNKTKTFSLETQLFTRNNRPGQRKSISDTIHRKMTFNNDMKVGKQFLA